MTYNTEPTHHLKSYAPSSLPTITSVAVVALRGIDADRVNEHMSASHDAPSVTLTGEVAQQVASLWRQLPPDEPYRCHIPPYGLRFRSSDEVVCQASICWRCNNIFGDEGGKTFSYAFDGESTVSKQLFETLQRAAGDELETVLANWIVQAFSPTGTLPEGQSPTNWVAGRFAEWWRGRAGEAFGDADRAAAAVREELMRLGGWASFGEALHEMTHLRDALGELRDLMRLPDTPNGQ